MWGNGTIAAVVEPDVQIAAFERILTLSPSDHQGAGFCLFEAPNGRSCEEMRERDGPPVVTSSLPPSTGW